MKMSGKLCTRCQTRPKAELRSLGDPVCCAFPDNGPFTSNNWNCATANAIRDLCEYDEEPADRRPISKRQWQGDQNYATIQLGDYDDMELPSGPSLALWVTWYKRRGTTNAMWILSEDAPPRLPTFEDCSLIIARLSERAPA